MNNADLREAKLGPLILPNDRILAATLAAACLRYVDLSGADLRHVNAAGTDLSFARLHGADVRKARFPGSCFTGARLPVGFTDDIDEIDGAVDLPAA